MPYPLVKCATPDCPNQTRAHRNRPTRTGYCRACHVARGGQAGLVTPAAVVEIPIADQVTADRVTTTERQAESGLKLKYQHALKTIDTLENQIAALDYLREHTEPIKVVEHFGKGTSEACPVLVASDWHCEEIVGEEVGSLNRYNPDIATERAKTFFQAGLRLLRLLNQDVSIKQVIIALLGDFITNDIHGAENAEKNAMLPTHALVFAQNLLIGGIQFLLDHSDYEFVIPCHSGNHARTTMTTRFSSENGHSLEYLMYLHLAAHFRHESRVKFIIADGYHSYLPVYDQTIRFHHGHGAKYQGGIGGIYIPVNKSIAQWQKGQHADLDVFGHFHQLRDGGNFICNGSLIGMNAFALSIKADYEPPRQALFLMDKRRGRTCLWPILV